MKTFLLVFLSVVIFSACSPAAPKTQAQDLPDDDVTALLASLAPANDSQASQVSLIGSPDMPEALREVLNLAAQRQVDLAGQEGWLHLQTRHAQPEPNPLSPFAPGLSQFIQDQWLALDGDGQVQKAVRKIMDESGKTLQIIVLDHGIWVNLTLSAQSQAETTAGFDPNFGFDAIVARMVEKGYTLNKSLLYRDCWYQGEKYTITDGQITYEGVFNSNYREWRWIKTWQVAQDGEVSLVDSVEVMLEEQAPEPPADVLALLEWNYDLP